MHHYQVITTVFRDSVFYASIIMMINFTFFLIFWEYSKNKSNKTFLIFNLGGMVFLWIGRKKNHGVQGQGRGL